MATFTEIVAAMVVHSSAVALSHFGMTLEPAQIDRASPPPVERVIARTPAPRAAARTSLKLASCPQARRRPLPIRT